MESLLLICDEDSKIKEPIEAIAKYRNLFDLICLNTATVIRSDFLRTTPVKGILFDCDVLDRHELALLVRFGHVSGWLPILIFANQISLYSYRKVEILKNMVAVQKPFDEIMCLSLLQKMIAGDSFNTSPCPRFITDESVSVTNLKNGLTIPTRMRNYSFGGAFLEYRGVAVKAGDTVSVSMSRGRHEKLQVTAKVVWTRDGDHARSPIRGFGVQFKVPIS